jgi:site-specific DNA-methyltransferase (adenine-specific)
VKPPAGLGRVLAGESRWAIELGDSFEVLRRLPVDCVDHTISDPPYDGRTSRGARTHREAIRRKGASVGKASKKARYVPFEGMQPGVVLASVLRATRRWSVLFCSLEQLGAYADAGGAAWVRAGVWHRLGGAPQFSGDRPAQGAEGVAVLHTPGRRKRWNGGGFPAFWECARVPTSGRPGAEERVHPTQKPVELMATLVELFTDPDDLVLDPFCGSGTTGLACLRLGRRFIGIELRETWAEVARARLRAEEQHSTLAAVRAGQRPLFCEALSAAGGAL